MPRPLHLTAVLLTTAAVALPAAAADAAIFTGKKAGYKLTFNSNRQMGVLVIPQAVGGGQTVFTVYCSNRASRKGKLALGVAPITTSRRLSGPLNKWRSGNRRCTVTTNDQTVAKIRLRRR